LHGNRFKQILQLLFVTLLNLVEPEIVVEVENSVKNETNLAVFTCQATGEPVPNISWYFNGVMVDVSDTSKYMIMSTSINTTTTENKLTVYNITSSDVGTYTCNATNIIGSDVTSGTLTVHGMQMLNCTIGSRVYQ